jgi:hypothetical protein
MVDMIRDGHMGANAMSLSVVGITIYLVSSIPSKSQVLTGIKLQVTFPAVLQNVVCPAAPFFDQTSYIHFVTGFDEPADEE